MEIVVELYVCEKCSHVENELNGACPECGGVMKCVDFVPRSRPTKDALDLPSAKVKFCTPVNGVHAAWCPDDKSASQ